MKEPSLRYHEIDALRVIALALLIIYHIFICYQPDAGKVMFIEYDQTLEEYWFIGELLNIWRIPVLFVISGMAVGFVLPRRTVKELVHDRMMRLVPPLVFGSLVIVPVYPALYAVYQGDPAWYFPNPGHLWFLINLVSYTILLLPLIVYVKKRPDNNLIRGLRRILPFGVLIAFPLPLILETVVSQPRAFEFFPIRFLYGLVCYGIGFLLVSVGEKFWTSIRIVCHVALLGAMTLYAARLDFVDWDLLQSDDWTIALESGLWMLAFLGYGSLLLNRPSRVFGYLNKAVFPIYIIHMPVQQLVVFLIYRWKLRPEVTFGLHVFFTFAVCGLLYELVIRRIHFLYPVMGLKQTKIQEATSQPGQPTQPRFWPRVGSALTLYVLSPLVCIFPLVMIPLMMMAFGMGDSEDGLPENPAPVPLATEPSEFGDHYYQVFGTAEPIEWEDAAARCEAMGGYLVIINDAQENDFLTSIGTGNGYYHLGASDHEMEGEWRWVDGTPMVYENWHESEPNNFGGDEDYLNAYFALWPKWNDAQSAGGGFICEWDAAPDTALIEVSQ